MAGVVRRRQERTSARDGSKFAFVSLSDPSGEYEVMFQSDALRRCRDYLETGRSVVIRVRAKAGDGEVRLYAEDAEPIDRVLEQGAQAGLRVHVSPRSAEVDALKRRLEGAISARGGEITLVAGLDGREVELKLPGRFNLDAALRGALKTAPGVAYLEDV
jgi:DNA polymerase-3 subunit alpha